MVRKLCERKTAGEAVSVVGIVRSDKAKQQLLKDVSGAGLDAADVRVVPGYEKQALKEAMAGCDKMVILTSAKPKLVVSSLFGVMWNKYVPPFPSIARTRDDLEQGWKCQETLHP